DGALKRQLELPSSGWLRRYRVRAHGRVTAERLAALAKGVTVEGVDYGPVEATLDHQTGSNAWLTIGLREGKNREVRRICAHLGLTVNRLIRIAYGPFTLGNLPKRALHEVEPARLRYALGLEEKSKKKQGKGFAKAKPQPNRPGSRRGFKHQREAAERERAEPETAASQKKPAPRQAAAKRGGASKAAPKLAAGRGRAAKPQPAQTPLQKTAARKTAAARKRAATTTTAPKQPSAQRTATKKAPTKPDSTRQSHARRRRPS
ncbi:MAG TPA: hypothetical protein VIR45_08080, partial [Kiloniellaceae bacterium]